MRGIFIFLVTISGVITSPVVDICISEVTYLSKDAESTCCGTKFSSDDNKW